MMVVTVNFPSLIRFHSPTVSQSFIENLWWTVFLEMATFPTLHALPEHGHSQQAVELFLFLLNLGGPL